MNATHRFGSWDVSPPIAGTAQAIAQKLDEAAWQRLSAGEGTKGAQLYDWAYCALADLNAAEYDGSRTGTWTRGLLIRRTIADGDLAFFSTWCPAGTTIETPVKIEAHRWAIDDSSRRPRMNLASITTRPGMDGTATSRSPSSSSRLIRWSVQEIRRIAHRLAQRRIAHAAIIAWSCWRRAYQAKAQQAHLSRKQQL